MERPSTSRSDDSNYEVDSAGIEAAMTATKFAALQLQLSTTRPVPLSTDPNTIRIGAGVILSKNEGEPTSYVLVGEDEPQEAWPGRLLMSVSAPVGRKLLGKCIGTEFSVSVKGIETYYQVLGIGLLTEDTEQPELDLSLQMVTTHG